MAKKRYVMTAARKKALKKMQAGNKKRKK